MSRTDRETTPSVVAPAHPSPSAGPWVMRPRLGLRPTSPHSLAGTRIEPPPSLACATGTMPAATAAADPPEDPPVECSGFHGLRLGPKATGSVVMVPPNSGVFVRPRVINPAARNDWYRYESAVARTSASLRAWLPSEVGSPAISHPRSFTRNGTPRNGPSGIAPAASARAASNRSWITALIVGSWRCTLAMASSTSSSGDA